MKSQLGLGKLTLLYTIGNLASKVISFGLFFVYTFYLSKTEIGLYDIIITAITLLAPVITLQVYDSVLRKSLSAESGGDISKIFTNGIAIISISNLVFTATYIVIINIWHFEHSLYVYMILIIQNYYLFFSQFNRGIGNTNVYVVSNILYSLMLLMTTSIALIYFNLKIDGLLLGNIFSLLVSNIYLLYKLKGEKYFSYKEVDIRYICDLLSYSIPLIPNTLSWWIISAANRYIILFYLGANSNGLFAVALKFPSIHIMITGIFSMAWTEKMLKLNNDTKENFYFSFIFEKYFFALFGITTLLISTSRLLIQFSTSSEYHSIWNLMPILYIAVTFQGLSSFLGTIYLKSNNTKNALKTTIQGSIVTLITSIVLIPIYGLIGASIAICLGYFTIFIVRLIDAKKYFNISISVQKILLVSISIIIITYGSFSENKIFITLNILFSIAMFCYFNKSLIYNISQKVSSKVKLFYVREIA